MGGWGASLTAAFIALPTGSDTTAAARGSSATPGRKLAEGRPGPCGSEHAGGDADSRDYAAESGVSRSPGESCASACLDGRRGLGGVKLVTLQGCFPQCSMGTGGEVWGDGAEVWRGIPVPSPVSRQERQDPVLLFFAMGHPVACGRTRI